MQGGGVFRRGGGARAVAWGGCGVAVLFRVRYSDTDQMGTYSSARVLEWFEHGRTEFLREKNLPYALIESRGVFCPVIEAHVCYRGRARYDDLLRMNVSAALCGKARVRFDVTIVHDQTGEPVADGYTIHAFVNSAGKPIRPPNWFTEAFSRGANNTQ